MKSLCLLTMKPMIYAANVAEGDMADRGAGSPFVKALKAKADEDSCEVVVIAAQVSQFLSSFKLNWTSLLQMLHLPGARLRI